MYSVGVQVSFSAAHRHPGSEPGCGRLHGHNYRVEVEAESPRPRGGMVIDFLRLTRWAEEAVRDWDHRLLNEAEDFKKIPPTTENISRIIFRRIARKIPAGGRLRRVRVWETDDSWAAYEEKKS